MSGWTADTPARPSPGPPSDTASPVEIVGGPKAPTGGFQVQPRRWVVERTNGRINHNRRLVSQYQNTAQAHEGFLILSQIALLLRRLDRGPVVRHALVFRP